MVFEQGQTSARYFSHSSPRASRVCEILQGSVLDYSATGALLMTPGWMSIWVSCGREMKKHHHCECPLGAYCAPGSMLSTSHALSNTYNNPRKRVLVASLFYRRGNGGWGLKASVNGEVMEKYQADEGLSRIYELCGLKQVTKPPRAPILSFINWGSPPFTADEVEAPGHKASERWSQNSSSGLGLGPILPVV